MRPGKNTSAVSVEGISRFGVWLYVEGREFFLPHKFFPWFKKAKIEDICRVKLIHGRHLFWPKLDIDLELDSLTRPQDYPLRYH